MAGLICGISILSLTAVKGYNGLVIFAWVYGCSLGGYNYALKVYTYERVRARHFPRAWSFIQCSQAIPLAVGVPLIGMQTRLICQKLRYVDSTYLTSGVHSRLHEFPFQPQGWLHFSRRNSDNWVGNFILGRRAKTAIISAKVGEKFNQDVSANTHLSMYFLHIVKCNLSTGVKVLWRVPSLPSYAVFHFLSLRNKCLRIQSMTPGRFIMMRWSMALNLRII